MKIYKISQDVNNDYDAYKSAVVYANNEEEAKSIHPNEQGYIEKLQNGISIFIYTDAKGGISYYEPYNWAELKYVKVEYLGENPNVTEKGVILVSFNAG